MFFYYFRQVMGYAPLVLCWICFLYLLALYKAPEIVADLLDEDSDWLRRTTIAILFVGFFFCTFSGGAHLVLKSHGLRYWDEDIRSFIVGIPLLFGSAMVASYLIGMGVDVSKAHKKLERQKRYNTK